MTLLRAAMIGIVHGVTEFIPASSSGHLVLGVVRARSLQPLVIHGMGVGLAVVPAAAVG